MAFSGKINKKTANLTFMKKTECPHTYTKTHVPLKKVQGLGIIIAPKNYAKMFLIC